MATIELQSLERGTFIIKYDKAASSVIYPERSDPLWNGNLFLDRIALQNKINRRLLILAVRNGAVINFQPESERLN